MSEITERVRRLRARLAQQRSDRGVTPRERAERRLVSREQQLAEHHSRTSDGPGAGG